MNVDGRPSERRRRRASHRTRPFDRCLEPALHEQVLRELADRLGSGA